MSLVKVLAVLSLLVAGSYGRSHSDRSSKWTTGQDEAPGYNDRPVHFFSESKYRLDEVPCYFTAIPPDNTVNHYSTFVYRFSYYTYRCFAYNLQTQKLKPYDNQGVDTYNLMSPGFDSSTSTSYPSRRLSYYHIKCKKGTVLNFHVVEFALQDKIRVGYNERKCVDYVSIRDLNNHNYQEFCGTRTAGKLNSKIYGNDVLVTFRTSRYNNHYKGFLISAICNVGISSMENCLKVEEMEYATDKRTKIVPKYALTELRKFLRSREHGEDGVWMMSDDEAVWNTDILSLAVLSERSCDAEYKRAGKAVLNLFPQWIVKKEREDYMKDAELYV